MFHDCLRIYFMDDTITLIMEQRYIDREDIYYNVVTALICSAFKNSDLQNSDGCATESGIIVQMFTRIMTYQNDAK